MLGTLGATREDMVSRIKYVGQKIIDLAEEIVGDSGQIDKLTIWVEVNADGIVLIDVQREYPTQRFS